jgi:hypothetical protein
MVKEIACSPPESRLSNIASGVRDRPRCGALQSSATISDEMFDAVKVAHGMPPDWFVAVGPVACVLFARHQPTTAAEIRSLYDPRIRVFARVAAMTAR